MRSDLAQRAAFDLQSIEKPRDEPTPPTDGNGRKPPVAFHVIGERLDLLRVGIGRSRLLLQTPHKLEPSDGDWIEGVLAGRLTFDVVASHDPVTPTGESQNLRNREKIAGSAL